MTMNKILLSLLAVPMLWAGGCEQSSSGDAEKKGNSNSLTGTFESKKGVMTDVSCYCYNVGYLNTGGEQVAVCFDELPNSSDLKIECKGKMTVEGSLRSKSTESNGPCPGGTMELFYVTKWTCP